MATAGLTCVCLPADDDDDDDDNDDEGDDVISIVDW